MIDYYPNKLDLVMKATWHFVWRHKLYFLLPILTALVLLTFLAYYLPEMNEALIYAGL